MNFAFHPAQLQAILFIEWLGFSLFKELHIRDLDSNRFLTSTVSCSKLGQFALDCTIKLKHELAA